MSDTRTTTQSRTYRGPGGAGAPRLAGLPGVHREDVALQQVLETQRYDTDDRRLARAGITLAVYSGGDDPSHWQLDLPDGETAERLRVPLAPDAGPAPAVPGELDELVRGVTRERALRPTGQVRVVRTETRLLAPDDRVLAVVVHDEVSLATLGASTEVEAWTEAGVRAVGADDAVLAEIERRLAEVGLRPAARAGETELDRLVRPTVPAQRAAGGPRGSAGAALLDYLAAQVDRIAAEDLRVRRGEPDAVHQLRVAARRLRSALQAYRPLLDRERTEPLVDGLRGLGRRLAPARDAEVLHEHVTAGLAGLGPELLLGPVQAQVARHFARVEAEAGAEVLTALDGGDYAALRRGLDDLLERPPLRKRARRRGRKELPAIVARSARRLERAVATAMDPSVPAADRAVAVHSARKAGKRLRYATEVARPVVGRPAKTFAKGLKGLQSALGEHQDTVAARGALRELGALAHSAGENGFSFGVLHGRDAARASRIEDDLPDLWAQAWSKRRRRWLR